MSKRRRAERRGATRQRQAALGSGVRWGIVALSLAGIAISAYLTYVHYTGGRALCPVGSGCDRVQTSPYASILGIPVALMGLVGYAGILVIALGLVRVRSQGAVLYGMALAGFVFASYLTFLEVFVIKAVCLYCVASYGIITAILVLLLAPKPVMAGLPWREYRGMTVAIIVVVLVGSAFFQRGATEAPIGNENGAVQTPTNTQTSATVTPAGTESGYAAELAKFLTSKGVVMYGAYWCSACATQKAIFGSAFKYVTYVECDPGGASAKPALCNAKGVKAYPTWEINGGMRQGVHTLRELAQLTGFTGIAP